MENCFGIIGGMGTMATEDFVHTVNRLTVTHRDQDYLNYVVLNDAQIPDRTAYILDHNCTNPLPSLKTDVQLLNRLGAKFIVMTCNTAHYFIPALTAITNVPILNMPALAVEAACQLQQPRPLRIGILATTGTLKSQLYQQLIRANGHMPVVPTGQQQAQVMALIYEDIKQHDYVDRVKFHGLIDQLLNAADCDVVILGCTELSVAQDAAPYGSERVIDAQYELARVTVQCAQAAKPTMILQRQQSMNGY
ncbi:amino acid racemase [Lactiplantibacillus paraplantarum]|uniref:aspartate/glutamate racemase family protein n=1 Tax=Lactiplantibacillus paraplantarum TaxID=60520 RepID=UPI000512B8FD|nr:amino acid racemase [Lactiplantibacillus paraplantarum]OAX74417.1 aspartate racemase [Lactiplantibacillus plantarum]ALO03977.1 aspartate racemase [Lactiplantibacillus paraplantarum]KGE75909.1 aspartate racemase [Lactiplantibacillus paraplantarum]MCW1910068.1 amino acid racemase [Lactiplantibacillus paraplantarum]RDG12565.1 aspartate/glutamate racemase family protein [Lactiplantibacillus paraplantarum]